MVTSSVEARKQTLPNLTLTSPKVTSFLYDPISLTLALTHHDSTLSLLSPFSPSSSSSSPLSPHTLLPPPTSSLTFVSLSPNAPNSQSSSVLVTSGPHSGGSRVILRFYDLGRSQNLNFLSAHVDCSQKGVFFDVKLRGVVVSVGHGMKVLLSGGVNYFALYSPSAEKIWVFGVRVKEEGGLKFGLRLVKCAVVECRLPVFTMSVSFEYLMLGELNGVRVFPLRALVKGSMGKKRRATVAKGKGERGRKLNLPNGVVGGEKGLVSVNLSKGLANGFHVGSVRDEKTVKSNVEGDREKVKLRSLQLRQDSGEVGMQFVLFSGHIVEGTNARVLNYKTTKAISIQALSQMKFIVLDSNGCLHVLHMSKSGSAHMRLLTGLIQVQQLAVFPDLFANTQNVWLTDGLFSVHKLEIPETDPLADEDVKCGDGKMIQSSVAEAIFTNEKIQDMVALAANTVLILGQDNLYAYAIS